MYETILKLCENRGISISKMCKESGVHPASLSDLKMGRVKQLSSKNVKLIADYFGVSADYIISGEETKKTPPTTEEIKFALFGAEEGITDEMWQDVLDTIEFIKFKHRGGSSNGNG